VSRLVLVLLLGATLYVASLVVWPVEQVVVAGHVHLDRQAVLALADLYPGDPWLWATNHSLARLRADPWVLEARLERPRIGVVRIVVRERVPVATLQTPAGLVGLAADGTRLPGAEPTGPVIEGFGEDRTLEALQIAALLPDAERISYNPAGFTVDWEGRHLWIRSLENLRVWMPRVNMIRGNDVAIYSWGVSIRR
jgi:cell division protein FtsQ